MSKQIVFKKVMVSDRLPKDGGHYYTNINELYFDFGNWHDSNYRISTQPEWWIEEIEIPSEEEIDNESYPIDTTNESTAFIMGANYILNKLK